MHIPTFPTAQDAEPVTPEHKGSAIDAVAALPCLGFLRIVLKSGAIETLHHVDGAICPDLFNALKSGDGTFVVPYGKRRSQMGFIDIASVAFISHDLYDDAAQAEGGAA
ncbi:hypothetical protein QWZ10_11020 [Paracoccus cavernae]|uniref:Uncharacterized protein n=1 Tax=Paracoccus cavernae TaxID=1571207 RepID=A0ABT8D8E9_9RHOB|nr:hypothetical protein [Paracoccus cavernae]